MINAHTESTKNSRGFTLVEVLIAVGITSAALVVLSASANVFLGESANSLNQSTALRLAEEKIEQLYSTPFAAIVAEPAQTLPVPFDKYEREVIVTNYLGFPDLKQVTVNVNYGGSRLCQLNAVVGDY
jgi:prepilin-type N-terminal cleavage/methylation domain-containing protein